jgi:ketosteroid isomerase-like protein
MQRIEHENGIQANTAWRPTPLCDPQHTAGKPGNTLMRKLLLLISLLNIAAWTSHGLAQQSDDMRSINAVLDAYHTAASNADWQSYFELMSSDAVFLGTDASERWPKEAFRAYAGGRNGWTYFPQQRNVTITPDGNSAWFDEILSNASYGTCRGSGVLIRTADGWKISQYHLTFPIPNALARGITETIKAYEAGN